MSNIRKSSKSGLFLIELIIAIVFFALTSAVCVQLFVRAHLVSRSSSETTTAVIEARNAAECFRASGGSAEKLASLLGSGAPEISGESERYAVYYDGDWQRVSAREKASYELSVDVGSEGGLATAGVAVRRIGEESVIFRLESKSYSAEE